MKKGKISFAMGMKKYFGLLEGQSLADFAAGLRSVGIDCEDPIKK